jgi:hypothetical protein
LHDIFGRSWSFNAAVSLFKADTLHCLEGGCISIQPTVIAAGYSDGSHIAVQDYAVRQTISAIS